MNTFKLYLWSYNILNIEMRLMLSCELESEIECQFILKFLFCCVEFISYSYISDTCSVLQIPRPVYPTNSYFPGSVSQRQQ